MRVYAQRKIRVLTLATDDCTVPVERVGGEGDLNLERRLLADFGKKSERTTAGAIQIACGNVQPVDEQPASIARDCCPDRDRA
jgi:hypothetical protein